MINTAESAGVLPLARVVPVLPVVSVADPLQELADRATQFTRGQDYIAQVGTKINDSTFIVNVGRASFRMELGQHVHSGQQVALRFIQASPVPTFAFIPEAPIEHQTDAATATLSSAARFIEHALAKAELTSAPSRIETAYVVSTLPENPAHTAHQLKQVITTSGLFYEPHLQEFVEGKRSLFEIRQEPQNQAYQSAMQLLPQQLHVLENQRVSWHGEVWPQQQMDWHVFVPDQPDARNQKSQHKTQSETPVVSDMTLDLPHLGKVTAKLVMSQGRMQLKLLAAKPETMTILQNHQPSLAEALTKHGQRLERVQVLRDEWVTQDE